MLSCTTVAAAGAAGNSRSVESENCRRSGKGRGLGSPLFAPQYYTSDSMTRPDVLIGSSGVLADCFIRTTKLNFNPAISSVRDLGHCGPDCFSIASGGGGL